MPVAPDVHSLTTAAEQAAGGGDFASAANYLKLAADLQEAGAGSMPVELANTLNNLGVVYERLERPADAERCYRRAHAVACAVLPADHPSVALSEKNLRDFCEGRGIPFEETPVAPPKPAVVSESPTKVAPPPVTPPPAVPVVAPPADPVVLKEGGSRNALVLGGIAVLAVGALAVIAIGSFGTSDAPATPVASAPAATTQAPAVEAPPAVPPPAVLPEAVSQPTAAAPEPAPVSPARAPERPAPERAARPAVAPTVVSASLCGTLDTSAEWQCGPPSGGAGTFYFYTRLAAPVATTVQHRWYRDGRLHQTVSLRVAPNPQHGFRTYSRITIGAERSGEWRAELRSPDGTILHEERFTVAR